MQAADLAIEISRLEGGYSVDFRFTPPDSEADMRLLERGPARLPLDLAALRALSDDDAAYGTALSDALFSDAAVRSSFSRALAVAEALSTSLRVRLIVEPQAAELHAVHWERLRDPASTGYLFLGDEVWFSRYLSSVDFRPVRLRSRSDLRALVAIANPSDIQVIAHEGRPLAPLNAAREIERATAALGQSLPVHTLPAPGRVTMHAIVEELRDGYDILYLVCHGELRDGKPHIYLEDSDGRIADVAGEEFVRQVTELLQRPRLVVLASCESAGDGQFPAIADDGSLAALGPLLAEAGIPAVIAMQGKISLDTLSTFMVSFFREFSRSGEIDRAAAAGRAAIRSRQDWWMPVLFMRLRNGRISWYTQGFTTGERRLSTWPSLLRNIRNKNCTPILGAGLFESLLGSRERIAEHLAETIGYPLAPAGRNNLPQVAQYLAVTQDREFARAAVVEAFCRALWDRYPTLAQSIRSPNFKAQTTEQNIQHLAEMSETIWRGTEGDRSDPYRVLASFELPLYLTANQGTLLTRALEASGKRPEVLIAPWNPKVLEEKTVYDREPGYQPSHDRPLVYHLLGHFGVPDSLVLTEDDYLEYVMGITKNRDRLPPRLLRGTTDASLLILGFRLDEWDFRVLSQAYLDLGGKERRSKFVHVAAQVSPEEGRFLDPFGAQKFFERYLQVARIDIYWGSVNDLARELRLQWDSLLKPAVGA